jgi:hypothetical protein
VSRTVRELTSATEAPYCSFLAGSPQATVYASLEYREFLRTLTPATASYLIVEESGRIVGALPLFILDVPGVGAVVNSLPWYGSHGGCILAGDAGDEVRRALLCAYVERIADPAVLSATLILLPSEEPHLASYRKLLHPAAEDSRTGQMTVLPPNEVDITLRLEETFLRKTRNLVRKALRQRFTVDVRDDDEAWQFVHATHVENMRGMGGRPKPWSHFVAIRHALPVPWRRIFVASLEGRPVAALLLLYYHDRIEYFTPVIVEAYRSRQPLSCLIFHAMVDGARAGFRLWNWGGTWATQASLYHFKRGWGARDCPYTYLTNSCDRGQRLARLRDRLSALFPYYYAYPYDQLGRSA